MTAEVRRAFSTEDVVDAVRTWPRLRIVGGGTNAAWSVQESPEPLPILETIGLAGVVQHDVEDQVVVVRAGTSLEELDAALRAKGQCLPIATWPAPHPVGTVGGAVSLNLPHALEGQTGIWRDWVLGLTVVTASGEVVKCGSKAVKNVAGYDVQKLLLGARGTLGVITEVVLRTYPVRALPTPQTVTKGDLHPAPLIVQRVLRTDFEAAFAQYADALGEPETGTIWANLPVDQEPHRYGGDWLLRSHTGARNLVFDDPVQTRFMRRAKDLFDPSHRLNPGEMGIF